MLREDDRRIEEEEMEKLKKPEKSEKLIENITNSAGISFPKDVYGELIKSGYSPDKAYLTSMNLFGKKEDADTLKIPSVKNRENPISIKVGRGKTKEEMTIIIKKALDKKGLQEISTGISARSLKVEPKNKQKDDFGFAREQKNKK